MKAGLLEHTFRSLRMRNFRLFFSGQGISLIGTWIQTVAMSWLIYRMTHSAFMLGLVGFYSQIPSFFISPFAGVLIDRWNLRRLLLATQTLSMLQALTLAVLTLTGWITVWQILLLSALLGIVAAFDITGRQSFLIEMVEHKENLGNAIALNSMVFNLARLLGPSLAGIMIHLVGEGICFLINGVSYGAVIFNLLRIRVQPRKPGTRRHVLHELREGLQYTAGFPPIRAILLLLAAVSMMGMSYTVLMPVFAKEVFRGGPQILGFLMASAGVGAFAATLRIASQRHVVRLGAGIPAASGVFAAGMIAFAFVHDLGLAYACLAVAGFGLMLHMNSCNTVLQMIVEDDKRGRVMSFYTMAFMGMAPVGSFIAGWLANHLGAANTLLVGGLATAAASLAFAARLPHLQQRVRPIYERMGMGRGGGFAP